MSFKLLIVVVTLSLLSLSSFADVVNLNKANAAVLQYHLHGIGVKKAERIITYRSEHQGFKQIDEIMKVRGIGKKTFQKISNNLSLTEGIVSLSESKKNVKKIEPELNAVKEKKESADHHDVKNKEV